ncbi:hypothetical protein BC936DRAFT_140668 [Jimgerdemannia flammicorona]|uniref:Uncharacterized protein n=1 Tax=Jimgerdemannia flammicorona TaxID=994334 RepID=A0A433DGN5_9FUNG|nr:hypothetical protein BC936DRAFT_140668 [Jimgerdemannia flammicorona]
MTSWPRPNGMIRQPIFSGQRKAGNYISRSDASRPCGLSVVSRFGPSLPPLSISGQSSLSTPRLWALVPLPVGAHEFKYKGPSADRLCSTPVTHTHSLISRTMRSTTLSSILLLLRLLLLGLGQSSASPLVERDANTTVPAGPVRRTIQFTFGSKQEQVTVVSSNFTKSAVTGTTSNSYAFTLSTNWVPQIRSGYSTISAGGPTASGYSQSVDFWRLVEWNDTIDVTESTSTYDMYNIVLNNQWNAWTNTSITNDDGVVNVFQVTNKDASPHIQAILTYSSPRIFHHNSNNTIITTDTGSVRLTPNAIKYTLTISNWKYVYANSKLAVIQTVHSYGWRVQRGNGVTNSSTSIGTPFYTWNSTAIADGTSIGVVAQNYTARANSFGFGAKLAAAQAAEDQSWFSSAESFDIYVFSFDRVQPQKIVWDPALGFVDDI